MHVARKTFTPLKAKSRKRNADVVRISRFSHDVAEIVEVSLKNVMKLALTLRTMLNEIGKHV